MASVVQRSLDTRRGQSVTVRAAAWREWLLGRTGQSGAGRTREGGFLGEPGSTTITTISIAIVRTCRVAFATTPV